MARFTVDGGVPPADEALIRQGIELAKTFFASKGAPLARSFDVHVFESSPPEKGEALQHDGNLEFYPLNPGWISETRSYVRLKIAAHEYFHILQYQLGDVGQSPRWLLEGAAEFAGYSALVQSGIIDRATELRSSRLTAGIAALTGAPALQLLETYSQWQAAASSNQIYPLGMGVCELLVGQDGLDTLITYFRGMRSVPASNWPRVFEQSFGKSPSAFYDEVARART